ncbi:MAG: histidine--tRNA ligase [Proteobacteria bacterium]|jgi:histidyl-tRNA synthetase|nr:histidine--tRNA ligase [Pseudomonadota bacterium]
MNDVLPAQEGLWRYFEETVAAVVTSYGYRQIRTPILEHTGLFLRGIGEVTDIVEKEMYSFTDALNGEQLTLRPESTAGVVRAVIEHHLLHDGPQRLWYQGPMFRHERPQRGRYRQFHQVGLEALGLEGPDIDAELILLCARLWEELGLKALRLEINSLGQSDERLAHRQALIAYFEAHESTLDEDARRRLHSNPLRILDSKNPSMQALIEAAPRLDAFLGEASIAHFEGLQALLRRRGLGFNINPRLVRGLDYYNLSVFEWVAEIDGKPPLTVCGGGRYDGLIETLGGKAAPGCGFAIGVERILDLLQMHLPPQATACDVYLVHQATQSTLAAMDLAEQLRDHGLDVLLHCGGGSFKSQFRRADASGAAYAVVLGEDELTQGVATIKDLRDSSVSQVRVAMSDAAKHILEHGFGVQH